MKTFNPRVFSILVCIFLLHSQQTQAQKKCVGPVSTGFGLGNCKSECYDYEIGSTDVPVGCPFGETCCINEGSLYGFNCFQETTGIVTACLAENLCPQVVTSPPDVSCPGTMECCIGNDPPSTCTGTYNGANASGFCTFDLCYSGKVFAEVVEGCTENTLLNGCCIEDPERCIGEGEYLGQAANFEGVCRSDCGGVSEISASVAPCSDSQKCCIGERTVCVEETTDYLVGFCISECGGLTEYSTSARATCQNGLKCCGAPELGELCMATHEGEVLEGKCNSISYCGPEGVAGENGNCSDSASYCCVQAASEPEPVTGVEAVLQAITAVFNLLFGWLG